MRPAVEIRAETEALRAALAAGADVLDWRRRFTPEGFGALLERVHADPKAAAPVMLAWLELVGVYVAGVAERAPSVVRVPVRRRLR